MGYPKGWFTRENPNLKWMITRGTPTLGNPHTRCFKAFQTSGPGLPRTPLDPETAAMPAYRGWWPEP